MKFSDNEKKIINSAIYGNPTFDQYKSMIKINYLDSLIEGLKEYAPPQNFSNQTVSELNTLSSNLHSIYGKEDEIKSLIAYTKENYVLNLMFSHSNTSIDVDVLNELVQDTFSIAYKLKYFFNRPRPFQLSAYYKLKLLPVTVEGIDSPSYPCYLSLFLMLFKKIFDNENTMYGIPEIYKTVVNSKLKLAYNYPSDFKYSDIVYKAVINNLGFRKKYNILY